MSDFKSRKLFFENIQLNDDGAVVAELVTVTNPTANPNTQYGFYSTGVLTADGKLKITE